jgi:hypothetical protein
MTGPPTVLLRVKSLHAEAAMRQMSEARAAVAQAQERLTAKRRELEEYRAWRPGRERDLYQEIVNHEVSLGDVEELNAKVVRLRERERELMEEGVDLERALDAAVQAEHEAHAAWQAAQREVQKVEELLADWRSKEHRRVERAAELEMEEFSRPRPAAGHREGVA